MADENPTDQGAAGVVPNPHKEDLSDQSIVLLLVMANFPTQLRLSDLIREITEDSDDFQERDRVERAVRDLVAAGLIFRAGAVVLPTRSALRSQEILGG